MSKCSRARMIKRLAKRAERKQLRPKQKFECGDCTLCCTALGVHNPPEPGMIGMDKDAMVPCEYIIDGKCSIYEKRPKGCREYLCAYSLGMLGVPRPDEINCVIDFGAAQIRQVVNGAEKLVYHPDAVHIRPMDPGALERNPLLMERLAKERTCIVMYGEQSVGLMVHNEDHAVGDSTKKQETEKENA